MNLTQTAKSARIIIATVAVSLVVYSLGYFAFPYAKSVFLSIFTPGDKPLILFGYIPSIKFSGSPVTNSSQVTYNLNTPSGNLPAIPSKYFNVYRVIKPELSFTSGEEASKKALVLGFSEDELISGRATNIYKWSDPILLRDLVINTTAGTLDYKADILNNSTKFTVRPQLGTAGTAETTLSQLGYLTDTLYKREQPVITFGKLANGRIAETTTPSEIMFAKADFFRTIYQVPIYGPRFDDGLDQVIYSMPTGDAVKLKVLKVSAHEWSINYNTFGRYPGIPVSDAWSKVRSGQGTFAKIKPKTGSQFEPAPLGISINQIYINSITLAYYDSEDYQPVMQPIYVFTGNYVSTGGESGDVVIYYPALDPSYIKD